MERSRSDDWGCQRADGSMRAGAIFSTGPVRATSDGVEATDEGGWPGSCRSDTAQHESACACVMDDDPEWSRCMGQLSSSQQAIRAAGLDCHPTHSVILLATSEKTHRSAAAT